MIATTLEQHARDTGLDLDSITFTVSLPYVLRYAHVKDMVEVSLKWINKKEVYADFVSNSRNNSNHWHIRLNGLRLTLKERIKLKESFMMMIKRKYSEGKSLNSSVVFEYNIHNFEEYSIHRGHNFIKNLVRV